MEINLYTPEIPGSEAQELEAIELSLICGYLMVSSDDHNNYGAGTLIKIPIHMCNSLDRDPEDNGLMVTFQDGEDEVVNSPILDYMFI